MFENTDFKSEFQEPEADTDKESRAYNFEGRAKEFHVNTKASIRKIQESDALLSLHETATEL